MMLLSVLDPVGVKTRKGKRLRRRRYYNKVACVYVRTKAVQWYMYASVLHDH